MVPPAGPADSPGSWGARRERQAHLGDQVGASPQVLSATLNSLAARGAREEPLCSRGENLDIHAAASPSSLGSVIVDQHPHYIHIEILTLPSGYGGNLMSVSHTDRCSGSDLSPVHRMGIVAARPARCGCEVTCLTRNECSNTLAKVISIPSLLPQGRTGDNTVHRLQIAREVMQIQGKP